jgi:ABC-type multidrug transport system ATPase subunit
MHTANHLVSHCISGDLLRDRTILLVTHHVSLCLSIASYLVELSNGHIIHHGTVDDLQKSGLLGHITAEEQPPTQVNSRQTIRPGSSTLENEADMMKPSGENFEIKRKSRLPKGKLVEAETRAEGRVKTSTYLTYLRAGGWLPWFFTFFLLLSLRGITIGNQVLTIAFDEVLLTF